MSILRHHFGEDGLSLSLEGSNSSGNWGLGTRYREFFPPYGRTFSSRSILPQDLKIMLSTLLMISIIIPFLLLSALASDTKCTDEMMLDYSRDGELSKLQDCISDGSNVNAKDDKGLTPLMQASGMGHQSIVETLLQAGADVHAKGDHGGTPLMIASLKGHQPVVVTLLQAGADIHTKDDDGMTPLIWASAKGHQSTVETLLQAGADVHAKDNIVMMTALEFASHKDHKSIVGVLRKAGARNEL